MTVGYDIENKDYRGEISIDRYGRKIPKHAHGTERLEQHTSSEKLIRRAAQRLFDRIINQNLTIRRIYLTAENVVGESEAAAPTTEQINLFTDYDAEGQKREEERVELEKEKRRQQAVYYIKSKYGKNAILKGMNLEEGATAKERNERIGGHKA